MFASMTVEWIEPRKQVTEFWANSNERIARFLTSHPSRDVPILPATFVQNSMIVMESEILTPPTVC